MSEHVCEHCFRVHTPCCPQCGCRSGEEETAPDNPWRDQLIKAESENHCGDLACQTRRTAAAVAVLTGWNEHQDLCWAVEAFQVEIGVRDPALLGSEPSSIPSRGAIEAEAFERGQRSVREAYLAASPPPSAAPPPAAPELPDELRALGWEEYRRTRGWPTPNHMRRIANALDAFTPARYGEVLRWVADACDAALAETPGEPE